MFSKTNGRISFYWNVCINYFLENLTEHVNYAVEVEVFGGSSQDFMQEMMSPTFIVLASCIAFATLVVVLLLGLICNRLCRSKAQNNGYTAANLQVTPNFTSCGHEFYKYKILYSLWQVTSPFCCKICYYRKMLSIWTNFLKMQTIINQGHNWIQN